MGVGFLVLMLAFIVEASIGVALTNDIDASALQALRDSTWQNTPPNWVGSDPCADHWVGIGCTNSRITSITLSTMSLTGQLSGDLISLSELRILDLSYNKGLKGSLPSDIGDLKKLTNLILVGCGFSGIIPISIGSLQELVFLSLNLNSFSGAIPPSMGNLSKLYWLDLADNQLSGPIPVSSGSTPGLDMLLYTKHFHFGQNKLTGTIPPKLFSPDMKLIHVLFDNNQLSGSIPSTLGLVQTLEVVRFDRNLLNGQIPGNLNNLTKVHEVLLSNNRFTGTLPNLTGLNTLSYLDMSNNSFDAVDFPSWILTLQSLTTLMLEHTQVGGRVPVSLFNLANLQTVILKDNQLNGTLSFGSSISTQLKLVDLQKNSIDNYLPPSSYINLEISLAGNPVCFESGASTESHCQVPQANSPSSSYKTPVNNCLPAVCSANQTSSPNCKCASPYSGTLVFRAPSFSDLSNSTYYDTLSQSIMTSFQSHKLPLDSVSLSNPQKDSLDYLEIDLAIFPSAGDSFNRTGILSVGFVLSNQTYKPPPQFGPFYFIGHEYLYFSGEVASGPTSSNNSVSVGVIVGAAAGGTVVLFLLAFAGIYAYRQKRRADKASEQSNLFGSWNSSKTSGSGPHLKGARWFSLEELKKCTNNFSNEIGSGGYGKVYRGMLPTGQLVAVKRAMQGSIQGGVEFKNEIELLSRVHHKNLVGLVGFCFEHGEQILVYEFIPNGSLRESLSGKTGIRLDWPRRLRITLGTARGLQYLHELANPPIIHRDIKSNNILLDDQLNAKVADFGLCKLMGDDEKGHVTTQVKGTMGYLDPEYYMTQQLTEKSDVYSFGVVLLELITARRPIERGTYIVREVRNAMIVTKEMYGLHEVLDPNLLSSGTPLKGLEKYIDLAMSCLAEFGTDRPTMGDAAKEIESVMQLAGLNPNAESASASASYEGSKGHDKHPYSNESFDDYSGGYPPSKLEPK